MVRRPLLRTVAASAAVTAAATPAFAASAAAVVGYTPGDNPVSGYTTPAAALGNPEAFTGEGVFPGVVSPFNAPFGTDEIVSIGTNGSITLQLSHYALPRADGPEIGVFTNVGLIDASWFDTDPGNDGAGIASNPASVFSDNYAVVEVSQDGQTWVGLNGGNEILFNIPSNGYADAASPSSPTPGSVLADPTQPFTKTLSAFDGDDFASVLAELNGSAGGAWLDISDTGLSKVGFVRFLVPASITAGSGGPSDTNFELDAVTVAANATGAAVPEPASLAIALLMGGLALRRPRSA